ncbi:hypothetical protein BH753_gp082 [Bacillus phage Shbh1]|uniref:Uncharacterized protein n=1 Tax=Bacillus phage Shbh1 TaxID=1796992 RepID=A0A142F1A7_9CAUD|nr:hypothetical protein BH753_gp082 [Bacillus phage Shbh1]AMQ66564.1 hypothetical protein [Bacillus phage Shbh1]
MKVFRMNDYDSVCAETEDQAWEFYKNLTGFTEEDMEEDYIGEVSLDDKMLVFKEDYIEFSKEYETVKYAGEYWLEVPYWLVIEQENLKVPTIISSTEI